MSDNGHTLVERLAKVPRLLANYMPTWFRNRQPQEVSAAAQVQDVSAISPQQGAAAAHTAQQMAATSLFPSALLLATLELPPTLPDMLARVPHLLSCCIPHTEESNHALRVLRLVSKEISCTALQCVTRCSLEVGEGADPNPEQIVQLLGTSSLQAMQIVISTTSARPGPLLAAQLAAVTSQAKQVVHNMRQALRSVTCLTITVFHELHKSSRTCSKSARSEQSPPASCPAAFSSVSRAVCTILAPAMPTLKSLTVEGCCRDAALRIFGACCPQLANLRIEAIAFPIKALKNAHTLLPNLRCFYLQPSEEYTESPRLTDYVGACLHALQACTLLTKIVLELDPDDQLYCKSGSWPHVPGSLRELVSHCEIFGLSNASALLQPLHTFETVNTPERGLMLRILRDAPDLQTLTLVGYSEVLLCCNHVETMLGLEMVRERVQGGLVINIPGLGLEGSSSAVQAALAVLPPLASVDCCHLRFYGVPEQNCLAEVARVFPDLTQLYLASHAPWQDIPGRGLEMLGPLAACTALLDLRVRVQLAFSTSELVRLCLSMPLLSYFGFMKCKGASIKRLDTALAAKGRHVLTKEY